MSEDIFKIGRSSHTHAHNRRLSPAFFTIASNKYPKPKTRSGENFWKWDCSWRRPRARDVWNLGVWPTLSYRSVQMYTWHLGVLALLQISLARLPWPYKRLPSCFWGASINTSFSRTGRMTKDVNSLGPLYVHCHTVLLPTIKNESWPLIKSPGNSGTDAFRHVYCPPHDKTIIFFLIVRNRILSGKWKTSESLYTRKI